MIDFIVDKRNKISYNVYMFIQVSHESPISMLETSLDYNDYAYALVHLFETLPEYYQFFHNLTHCTDVPVLLDNSIFELKEAFDSTKYIKWIDKLQPNYYIVPDVLESASDTIQEWKKWDNEYSDSTNALKIGVVQGDSWNDLVDCYKFMSDNADYIAISFDYSYYKYTGEMFDNTTDEQLQLWCSGRQRLIHQLIDEGIWCWNKPHHLLGCSVAREFSYYVNNNIHNIKSCDTSNPIVAGIKGLRYNGDMGLKHKPKTLLADLINFEPNDTQLEDIEYNTRMFKKIINR